MLLHLNNSILALSDSLGHLYYSVIMKADSIQCRTVRLLLNCKENAMTEHNINSVSLLYPGGDGSFLRTNLCRCVMVGT